MDQVTGLLNDIDARYSTYRDDSEISRLGRGELARTACSDELAAVLDRCEHYRQLTGGYFDAWSAGRLDPAGFVKGWAIERVSELLVARGATRHSVNGGGDVQCIGGPRWRVGIADPRHPGRLAAVVDGIELAVATSGVEHRGQHIVDPHTGRPPAGLLSLTVIGRRITETDVFATSAFAMGRHARDWLEGQPGYAAFAITIEGETWQTSSWPAA
jgi:thiamine biosynthesis lipoprotein